jgi:hypothetical protein
MNLSLRSSDSTGNKRRVPYHKNFEIDLDLNSQRNLSFFISQELAYFNSLINLLNPRIRAFPEDFLSFKEKERKLWDACAEHAIDPTILMQHKLDTWPKHLKYIHAFLYDSDGEKRISDSHLNIVSVAATPARIHKNVRKAIASEIIRYMLGQAEVLCAGKKTEGLRAPMQMLQEHTIDTKRHLQIPMSLVKITWNEDIEASQVEIPYSKRLLTLPDIDISGIKSGWLIIRSPHPNNSIQKWFLDFKESQSSYMIGITDARESRRRRQ